MITTLLEEAKRFVLFVIYALVSSLLLSLGREPKYKLTLQKYPTPLQRLRRTIGYVSMLALLYLAWIRADILTQPSGTTLTFPLVALLANVALCLTAISSVWYVIYRFELRESVIIADEKCAR